MESSGKLWKTASESRGKQWIRRKPRTTQADAQRLQPLRHHGHLPVQAFLGLEHDVAEEHHRGDDAPDVVRLRRSQLEELKPACIDTGRSFPSMASSRIFCTTRLAPEDGREPSGS